MPFRGLTMLKSLKLIIKVGLCYGFAMVDKKFLVFSLINKYPEFILHRIYLVVNNDILNRTIKLRREKLLFFSSAFHEASSKHFDTTGTETQQLIQTVV